MKNTHKYTSIQDISLMREKRLLQEVGSFGGGGEAQESVDKLKENPDPKTQEKNSIVCMIL